MVPSSVGPVMAVDVVVVVACGGTTGGAIVDGVVGGVIGGEGRLELVASTKRPNASISFT